MRLDASELRVLRSTEGRRVNEVSLRAALQAHVVHDFTHCAAVDGSKGRRKGGWRRASGVFQSPRGWQKILGYKNQQTGQIGTTGIVV